MTVDYLSAGGNTYTVNVDLSDANIPEGAYLQVEELSADEAEEYIKEAAKAVDTKVKDLLYSKALDISIIYNNEKIQSDGNVRVEVTLQDKKKDIITEVVHFGDETEILDSETDGKTVDFTTDGFSVFAIVGTETIETTYLTADGETYKITVTYGPEAEIPAHSSLYVREVEGNEQEFINSVLEDEGSEQEFIGDEEDREDRYEVKIAVSRTFDIKIMDRDGKEVQPAENSAVKVTFELEEVSNGNLSTSVYHIHEENDGERSVLALDVETQQSEATVVTDSFSYFTVQFSYNGGPVYIRSGNALIYVSTIAGQVGLQGTVTGVSVDDPESIILQQDEQNRWMLKVPEPFSGEKTLSVTMNYRGAVGTFDITLKCDVHLPEPYNEGTQNGVRQQGDNTTFLHGCDLATIFILEENMKNPEVSYDSSRFAQKQTGKCRIGYNKGPLPADRVTTFDGWCCTLKYKNAAILPDGSLGDIELTFSDVSFYPEAGTTQTTYTADFTNVVEYDNPDFWLPRVESGNDGGNLAVGLEVKVTTRILNGDSTAVGNYYYGMRDIDIPRDRAQRAGRVLDAENHYCFSEQVEIVSGAQSVAYIPAASNLNGRYLCGIANNTGSDANGLLFTPTLGTDDPGEYGDGFATLADAGGFQIIVRSAAAPNGAVNTTVSPGSIGGLYARKTVEDGTRLDEQRNWEMDIDIDGTTFVDDHMKHGETVFVGAFARDYAFTAVEKYPNEWNRYETSWLVKAVEVVDGRGVEIEKGSGTGLSANGALYPRTIIEFVNKRIWTDDLLTVQKIVLNQEDPQELQRDWQFTLTLTDGTGDEEVPITGLAAPVGAQNWTEVENGVYKFTLKDKESLSIRLPKGCNYSVQEDAYPEYYTIYDHQQGTLSKETVATIKNIPKPDVTILKVDENHNPIAEARFKLLRKNESGNYVQVVPPEGSETDFVVPEKGYVIKYLDPGEYKLIETLAPKGYIILSSDFEFTLNVDSETGSYTITAATQREDVYIDNTNLTITVLNTPGKELPNTGGGGNPPGGGRRRRVTPPPTVPTTPGEVLGATRDIGRGVLGAVREPQVLGAVRTGDTNALIIWATILILAVSGFAGWISIYHRKKSTRLR